MFTGLKRRDIDLVDMADYDSIVTQINVALDLDVAFEHRFTLNGVEYGFIPKLDEITAGEYIDLASLGTSATNLHKVMAVLFRPVILSDAFGNYEIESYTANSEYADIMKQAPMNIVNGMLVFFLPFIKRIATTYPEIYGSSSGGSEASASDYFQKWGWYPTLDMMAGGDVLKIDAVTELPIHTFHISLAHRLDKQKMEANLRNTKRGKNVTQL